MRQQRLDFEDAGYRRLIAEVPFPPNIPRVTADTLRAVLLAIYQVDGGRPCWPGQEKIATDAGVCLRQCREALKILADRLEYIVAYRKQPSGEETRRTMTHYIIVWTELERRRQQGVWNAPKSLPVDSDPLPVDRVSLPVDPDPLPVDISRDYIPACAKRNGYGTKDGKEITSTSTSSATSSVSFDTRPATDPAPWTSTDGPEEWVEVVALLISAGIYVRDRLVTRWQGAGRDAAEVAQELRECIRVVSAPVNQDRLHNPKAALVARLETGVWPAAVIEDLDRVASQHRDRSARDQAARWESAVMSAVLDVRKCTPSGQHVDEAAVIERAVSAYGVPREVAAKERGVNERNCP